MKKIRKILVLVAITICILLLPGNKVNAMEPEVAGQYMASYARSFAKSHGHEVTYDYSPGPRSMAYNLEKCSDGTYHMDCVGFVSMVAHQAVRLR